MAPGSNRRLSKSKTVGVVGTAVAILATSYYLYQKLTSVNDADDALAREEDSLTKARTPRKSKCVIMSKSVQGLSIDWSEYVADEVVLLVPTSHTNESFNRVIEDAFYNSGNEHKVIYCDSMDGLWSCVRRLRKFQCILNSKDFAGDSGAATVPEDVHRFVKSVIDSDEEDVLVDTICN